MFATPGIVFFARKHAVLGVGPAAIPPLRALEVNTYHDECEGWRSNDKRQ